MDLLTGVVGLTALVGFGAGWYWRGRASRAEVEAGRLRAELRNERHAAHHDPLTGLPNRRAFGRIGAELLADADRAHLVAAVVDLDNFKQVNDCYGHAVGDEVLVTVARRFAVFTDPNLVARLGGDEFVGLLSVPRIDEHWLRQTGQRLAAALARPVPVAGGTVAVTASVGLAPARRSDDLDDVLRRADAAMYRAKAHPSRTAYLGETPACHPLTGVLLARTGLPGLADPCADPPAVDRIPPDAPSDRGATRAGTAGGQTDTDPPRAGSGDRNGARPALVSGALSGALAVGRSNHRDPTGVHDDWGGRGDRARRRATNRG